MRIQHNIMAMNAYRNYNNNTSALSKNLEKLSSGYRINRAGDDAAGLAISEKMRAQITGLSVAQKNAKDGISLVQTAEGALTEVHDMLNRMVELANQSANGTYDATDRDQLQKEIDQLRGEIDRIADSANFNGINLLDGGLTDKIASMKLGDANAVDMTDGVTINAPVDGAGTAQSYTVTIDNMELFGDGDSVSFDLKTSSGTQTITFDYDSGGSGDFTGATLADQLESLKQAMNATSGDLDTAGYTADYTLNDDGSIALTFTAKTVGGVTNEITDFSVNDKQSKVEVSRPTTGKYDTTNGTDQTGAWNLFGTIATDPNNFTTGDKLTFNFTVDGANRTVTLVAGEDFNLDGAKTAEAVTNAIVTALKNASFDDDPATSLVDESKFQLKDFVDFTANKDKGGATVNGSIQVAVAAAGAYKDTVISFGDVDITKADGASAGTASFDQQAAVGTPTADAAEVTNIKITGADGTAGQLSAGEQITIGGILADGREFSVTLTAGEDGFDGPLASLKSTLEASTTKITVTDGGKTSELTGDQLFTTGKAGGFTLSTSGGDTLVITNNEKGTTGTGYRAQITLNDTRLVQKDPVTVNFKQSVAGKDATNAQNVLTFDPTKVEQGTTVEIDGKTYEFVTDTNYKTHEDNVAVVVANLGDGATAMDLANALKDAMGASGGTYTGQSGDAAGATYTVKATNTGLEITSVDIGDGAYALDVAMGDSKPTSVVDFLTTSAASKDDPDAVKLHLKVGDTVTINGQVYEFTDGKRTQNEDAIQVDISGLSAGTVTAEQAAQALADKVNEMDGDSIVARTEDGKVILTSKYDGSAGPNETGYEAPEVELPGGSTSLTLQIGDTSDNFNQLTVEIKDMHAEAIGIGTLDISTQKGAQAAVDVIKEAINYVSDVRGTLGATQNRLDHTINNLSVMQENIQDAESTIRDTDVADEMMAYTKNNILIQSAQAMLAQANQVPQGVLQLLQ